MTLDFVLEFRLGVPYTPNSGRWKRVNESIGKSVSVDTGIVFIPDLRWWEYILVQSSWRCPTP
jgi:hypothetical protein